MPKKSKELKTRPDLTEAEWLSWLGELDENRGIDVRELYQKMIAWCVRKSEQPTRRRLLKWIENTRESVPIDINKELDCAECNNERWVRGNLETWPCPKCRPDRYRAWQKERGK